MSIITPATLKGVYNSPSIRSTARPSLGLRPKTQRTNTIKSSFAQEIKNNPINNDIYNSSFNMIDKLFPELSAYEDLQIFTSIVAQTGKPVDKEDLEKIKKHCENNIPLKADDIQTLLDKYGIDAKIKAELSSLNLFELPKTGGIMGLGASTQALPESITQAGLHFVQLQDIIQNDDKNNTKLAQFEQSLKGTSQQAYDTSLKNTDEKYKKDFFIRFMGVSSAIEGQSLSPEHIKTVTDILEGKSNITHESIEKVTQNITPAFQEISKISLSNMVKLNKANHLTKELNDILQEGKVNIDKLKEFEAKLGNSTQEKYNNSLNILGEHKEEPLLRFFAAGAALNDKILEKNDMQIFIDTLVPKNIDDKLNKELNQAQRNELIKAIETGEEIPKDIKNIFEETLTDNERDIFSKIIKNKKNLTQDKINDFLQKYIEPKIHNTVKKITDNIFDIQKILNTKKHDIKPEETKALDKEIVGDGKNQISQEEWDKLSDEDKHQKRLAQKLKNEFKESLLPEEQEKFKDLPPEEQKKMMQEKLGDKMSPEQQLELLEQHKNARSKYQEAYQKQMQERQDGEESFMNSQIAAAQQGITGAVSSINKAVQGLTQLAGAVSQLRASTLQAAQQNSENQARASAHNQQRMQQPQMGMMGQGGGYGMY